MVGIITHNKCHERKRHFTDSFTFIEEVGKGGRMVQENYLQGKGQGEGSAGLCRNAVTASVGEEERAHL